MRFVLDSHTLLWTLYEPQRLPGPVLAILEDGLSDLYISHASVWELTDKASKFRLPIAGSSADHIVQRVLDLGTRIAPIELEDVLASVKLPRHHNDPLDRVLIAQAQRLRATLMSKDGKFKFYDVPVFWG